MNLVARKLVSDFFASFPQKTYSKGSILIMARSSVPSILYIEKGVIRSYLISLKGNEVTINFFAKGAFIPAALAITKQENMCTYEAFTDITVRAAPTQKVIQFLQTNSLVVYDLLQRVYKGMEGIFLHKEFLVDGNSRSKLAYVIVNLARRFGQLQHDETILIPMDLDEIRIASIAGIARETVSREIRKFQEQGIISYQKKKITINNLLLLKSIIESVIDTF